MKGFREFSEGVWASFTDEEMMQQYDVLAPEGTDYHEFCMGMKVELEHQDITHGDPYMTALIALAHLKEVPDYYTKLKKVEGAGLTS